MNSKYKADIKKARKQLVAQRNDFIQDTGYSLGVMQANIFRYMLSKIKPTDTPDKEYEYKYKEMFAVLQYRSSSYTYVKAMLKSMNSIAFWRKSPENKDEEELISLFQSDSIRINVSKSSFFCKFGEKMWPYIMELQKQQKENGIHYTAYPLQMTVFMKHQYSFRIYDLLESHSNREKWVYEVGTGSDHDLHRLIASRDYKKNTLKIPKGWSKWHTFERDVIIPAVSEINEKTDLSVSYRPMKIDLAGKRMGRYTSIEFTIKKKSKEEMDEIERVVDSSYEEYYAAEFSEEYHQVSLEEFMSERESAKNGDEGSPGENTAAAGQERAGETGPKAGTGMSGRKSGAAVQDDEAETEEFLKRYPICAEELGDRFSGWQIRYLVMYALREKIDRSLVPKDNEDVWACDYIYHYLEWVEATRDRTRTDTYTRLLDTLKWDKDAFADEMNYKWRRVKKAGDPRPVTVHLERDEDETDDGEDYITITSDSKLLNQWANRLRGE